MNVTIRFENVHTDAITHIGPYDFVQLTYDLLRVGPSGDELASFEDGWWKIIAGDHAGEVFSDAIIHADNGE